jgi:hypothetical protein
MWKAEAVLWNVVNQEGLKAGIAKYKGIPSEEKMLQGAFYG